MDPHDDDGLFVERPGLEEYMLLPDETVQSPLGPVGEIQAVRHLARGAFGRGDPARWLVRILIAVLAAVPIVSALFVLLR